jgi:osmotically-inducible protein OsmY
VTLKGKVDSADMKKKAGDVAKKVSGVKSVKNELKVEKKS